MENIGRSGLVKPESFRRRTSPHNEPLPKKTSQLRKLIGVQTKILICRSIFSNIFEGVNKAMYLSIYLLNNLFTYSSPHNDFHPTKTSTPPKFSSREKILKERCQKPLIIATFLYYHHYYFSIIAAILSFSPNCSESTSVFACHPSPPLTLSPDHTRTILLFCNRTLLCSNLI